MDKLPNELIHHITVYLSPQCIAKLSCVFNPFYFTSKEIEICLSNTPWFNAILFGSTKLIDIFLKQGKDISFPETTLAIKMENIEMLQFLLSRKNPEYELYDVLCIGEAFTIQNKKLIKICLDPNEFLSKRYIISAIKNDNTIALETLFETFPRDKMIDNLSDYCIHEAIIHKSINSLKFFIKEGFDINKISNNNIFGHVTPLCLAT